jgi:hypothetical protein
MTSDSFVQFPQHIHCDPRMPATRPQSAPNDRVVRYGHSASHLRRHHHRPSICAMPTNPEAMGEAAARILLEPERAELLFLLAMRVHNTHRRCPGSGTCTGFLEATDAALDEDRTRCHDEHDNAERDRHDH